MKLSTFLISFLQIFSLLAQGQAPIPDSISLWQPYRITPRQGVQHLDLSNNWTMGYMEAPATGLADLSALKDPIAVAYPTTVQMALYKAGKLPHPYYNQNSKQHEWVDKKVWYYQKKVRLPRLVPGHTAFLSFEGLDYFARIWVNGTLMGRHEGMFGGPALEVTGLLRPGEENEIVVELRSGNYGNWQGFDFRNPGRIIKSIDQAGGEGSKPFFALGMWRGVRLDVVPPIHLERPFLVTRELAGEEARLTLSTEVFVRSHSLKYRLHPWHNAILSRGTAFQEVVPASEKVSLQLLLTDEEGKTHTYIFPVDLMEGRNWIERTFILKAPRLWWPVGMGSPHCYQVRLSLLQDGRETDIVGFTYGIRTISNRPTAGPRTTERWDNWQYEVNGKPLFIKGMNWMPADALLDLPRSRYQWLLGMARQAGIQMVRVWGGGLLETDDFYELCDSLGIMVWQDFPVWHQDTPQRPQDVWEALVLQNIFRLRNHPSLALYCGGNGFNPFSYGSVSTAGILERSLRSFDPSRPFVRTSSDAGNIHTYPDMDPSWYGYLFRYVPFISESGMHSVAEAGGLRELISAQELESLGNIYSPSFAQTHPEISNHFVEYSADRVPRMLSRASHIVDVTSPTLESMAEGSQVGAGEFYQLMSEGMQANYPYTAGLMPWVYKRPWPVFSAIMLVDGFGQPTAPFYFLKRTYEPTHIALQLPHLLWAPGQSIPIKTVITHAGVEKKEGLTFSVSVYDDTWKIRWKAEKGVILPTQGPAVVRDSLGVFNLPTGLKDRFVFLCAELRDTEGKVLSRSVYWPRCLSMLEQEVVRKKFQELPNPYGGKEAPWPALPQGPWLKPTVQKAGLTRLQLSILNEKRLPDGDYQVEVLLKNAGAIPAFMTQLDVKGVQRLLHSTDNFFWLAAGESRTLTLHIQWRQPLRANPALTVWAWNATPQSTALRLPVPKTNPNGN